MIRPRAWGLAVALLLPPTTVVSVTVTPRLSLAPATVTLRIHIPPDADNRELRWTCAGDTFSTSGGRSLAGAEAEPAYVRVLTDLPRGEYACDVRVFNQADEPAVARAQFSVR